MKAMHTFNCFTVFGSSSKMILDMDTFNNQYVTIFLNFAFCFSCQKPFPRRNFTRFQRATKGSGQSAACPSYHIVKGGCVRLMYFGVDTIVLGNLRMYAK